MLVCQIWILYYIDYVFLIFVIYLLLYFDILQTICLKNISICKINYCLKPWNMFCVVDFVFLSFFVDCCRIKTNLNIYISTYSIFLLTIINIIQQVIYFYKNTDKCFCFIFYVVVKFVDCAVKLRLFIKYVFYSCFGTHLQSSMQVLFGKYLRNYI